MHPESLTGQASLVTPTRKRFFIMVLLFITVVINYLDRSNLSIAAPALTSDLGIDPVHVGLIFSAFGWTYAAMQIPGGWLVDRFAVPYVMCAAHALALGGGLMMTVLPAPVTAVAGLGMIGLGYGFISGATAAVDGVVVPADRWSNPEGRLTVELAAPLAAQRGADIIDHDVGALCREGERIGTPQPARGAGDDDGSVFADSHG